MVRPPPIEGGYCEAPVLSPMPAGDSIMSALRSYPVKLLVYHRPWNISIPATALSECPPSNSLFTLMVLVQV